MQKILKLSSHRSHNVLVKFFKRGDSASARGEDVLDYMLGIEWKHDNTIMREGASIIRGNPIQTTDIINNSVHKKKYLSGCLSFHAEEKIDETLQEKLMDEFEKCLLPGLDADQYSVYWVKHQDKKDPETGEPRLELNFIFACTELRQNKKLNVYYHYGDVRRIDLWQSIQNYDYQLLDPKDPIRTKGTTIYKNHRIPDEYRYDKKCIEDFIESQIQAGNIVNRETMLNVLIQNNYQINRANETSISILNPNGRNIKLKGNYYKEDFDVVKIVHTPKNEQSKIWHEQRERNMPQMREKFNELLAKRQQDLFERHVKNNMGFTASVSSDENNKIEILREIFISEEEIAYRISELDQRNKEREQSEKADKLSPEKSRRKKQRSSLSSNNLSENGTKPTNLNDKNTNDIAQETIIPKHHLNKKPLKKPAVAKIIYLESPTPSLLKTPKLKAQDDEYGKSRFTTDRNTIDASLKRLFQPIASRIYRAIKGFTRTIANNITTAYQRFTDFIAEKIGRNRKRRHKLNTAVNIAYHSTKRLDNELTKRVAQTNITLGLSQAGAKQAEQTTGRIGAIINTERQNNTRFGATANDLKSKINDAGFIDKVKDNVDILQEQKLLAEAIAANYRGMCQAGLIKDSGIEQYPLFKGLKALTALQLCEKLSDDTDDYATDETQFLYATLNYKQAMLGISEPQSDIVLEQRWKQGTFGFSELLDYQQKTGLIDLKKPEHISLIQTAKMLAKSINDHMSKTFKDIGDTEHYIAENYYKADSLVTFTELLSHLDTKLGLTLTPKPKPETINEPPQVKRPKP